MSSKADEIVDKQGEPIEIGDEVATKMRGGKRTGIVSDIVASEEDADKKGVKNPPKVLFEDQHGGAMSSSKYKITVEIDSDVILGATVALSA
ncbi:hypothetical protein FRC16_006485 [Serendipita sp. 398]|nr:hypothetical protein FRC16_006485 [Serendipita sp. 398]